MDTRVAFGNLLVLLRYRNRVRVALTGVTADAERIVEAR